MFSLLPKPPSLEDIKRATPPVFPLPADTERPFWSVVIPTYNCANYLRRTLESVLAQDPGPERMQIEVVDDCSTKDDPEAVVRELGKGRVAFFRQPSNQGAIRTFNTCIERARGRWVHILHGDDMVLPGFYQAYGRLANDHPDAAMILGQVVMINEEDRWLGLVGALPEAGMDVIADFAVRQALEQLGQFAGIVVRRSIYEQTGGFCSLFNHAADWDMWFRIGQLGTVVAPPRAYGLYRIHTASDTSRLQVTGTNVRETYEIMEANRARLGSQKIDESTFARALARFAAHAESTAWELYKRGSIEGRLNQSRWALMLEPNWRRRLFFWKSWLQHRLASQVSSPTEVKHASISEKATCSSLK